MSHVSSSVRRSRGVAAVLVLVAGLLAAGFGAAFAAPTTTPPSLVVTVSSVDSVVADLALAPGQALPPVLTAANDAAHPVKVTVSLSDGSDLSKGLAVNLTTATGTGKFSPASFKVSTKGPTATTFVVYNTAEDGVSLRASVAKATSTSPTPGTSGTFDVLQSLRVDPRTSIPASGFGSDTCNTRTNVSVCGVVDLSHGIGSAAAALSVGQCTGTGCETGGKEVQFIAGLQDAAGNNLYSRTDPAILNIQCDKAHCPGKGVSSWKAYVSLSATGALTASPPCLSKGVIPTGLDYCTDYVSSHRDNAGDVILQVLFFTDMRGTM